MLRNIPGCEALPEKWDYSAPNGVCLSIVRNLEDLSEHSDAWDQLFLKSNCHPTVSYAWIKGFFKHLLDPSETWICMFAYRGKDLIGVLPLIVRKAYRIAGLSVILFRTPYNEMHTSSVECLMPPDNDEAFDIFYECLFHIPRSLPIIRFREIYGDSPVLIRCALTSFAKNENYIPLTEDYETYRSSISSNLRRLLKRSLKKLNKIDNVSFVMREKQRSTEDNFNRFMDAEDASWKGEESSSIKALPHHADALLEIASELNKRGWVEWNFIETEDKTIAAHFAIRVNRKLYIDKIGYDEHYKDCSPGNLLFNQAIEDAFSNGDVEELNTGADCPWHYQWQVKSRKTYDAVIIPQIPVLCCILKAAFKILKKFHA